MNRADCLGLNDHINRIIVLSVITLSNFHSKLSNLPFLKVMSGFIVISVFTFFLILLARRNFVFEKLQPLQSIGLILYLYSHFVPCQLGLTRSFPVSVFIRLSLDSTVCLSSPNKNKWLQFPTKYLIIFGV
jgi:hypothetical protein